MKLTLLLISITFTFSSFADKAVFAGGCFWCMESDFEKLKGVSDVISGFTGGKIKNPTYRGNHKGHYEAVEVTYDPNIISYKDLLNHFWVNIDPFDPKGQFCDKGHSYLSAIFVDTKSQKELAIKSKSLVQQKFSNLKVVTPILTSSKFYPITGSESFHQNYYKNFSLRYKAYRWSCGRDKRLKEIWGKIDTKILMPTLP